MRKIGEEGWLLVSLVAPGAWREAARLIREGQADLLLLAFGPRTERQRREHELIHQAVERGAGEVVYCRNAPEPKPRLAGVGTDELIRRMWEVGCNTDQIATALRRPRERVSALIARLRGSAAPLIPALLAATVSLSDLGDNLVDIVT